MSLELRRRHFLAAGMGGVAALSLPGSLRAATMGGGFTHGVASGEPGPDRVLLWTRYPGTADRTELSYEVAEDAGFGRIVAEGPLTASEETGHCAKAVASGLDPATWYFYRFRAPDGTMSVTGRTRTLPAEGLDPFRMAVVSCSNLPYGYFNAYAHAAERNDVHLAIHLGDYFYEYAQGTYPDARTKVPGRDLEPKHEILTLADYHARYATYRADRDLQRLHQVLPMVSMWDDHEFANDAWTGGAENHQPETEGSWDARKAAAYAAYRHWLPVEDEVYRTYEIGDLATLYKVDTRIEGRDKQIDVAEVIARAGSPQAGLELLRGTVWPDPARQLLGAAQERWLVDAFGASVAAGKRWQVLAQQVVMGETFTPPEVTDWIPADAPAVMMERLTAALALAKVGLPNNLDAWGGYPAARSRVLAGAQAADANLVVLAGDSHNAWAFDLAEGRKPAGVEFGMQSVTSPGYEAYFTRTDPARMREALLASSPELRWCDTSNRGYGVVTLSAEEARCDWVFVDTIAARAPTAAKTGRSMATAHGRKALEVV